MDTGAADSTPAVSGNYKDSYAADLDATNDYRIFRPAGGDGAMTQEKDRRLEIALAFMTPPIAAALWLIFSGVFG